MRVLVTGASGFVGGHLACGLAHAGHEVYAVYLNSPVSDPVLQAAKQCLQVDLTRRADAAMLIERTAPQVIVHAAALARSNLCEQQPELAHAANAESTANLCAAAPQVAPQDRLPLMLYLSTDLVFDGTQAPPGGFAEEAGPEPATVYGKTKAMGERAALDYSGVSSVLRTCLVYGPRIGEHQGFLGWILRDLAAGKPVQLFTDEWRTPVMTGDITAAVLTLSQNHAAGNELPKIINVAGSERISRYDFGVKLCKILKRDSALLVPALQSKLDLQPPRSPDVSLDCRLLSELLGRPPLDVDSGLALTLR